MTVIGHKPPFACVVGGPFVRRLHPVTGHPIVDGERSGAAAVLDACRRCYASLYTDRAISYRQAKGFDTLKVAVSVGVQQMVRADLGGAGVMFSLDDGRRRGGF